MSAAARLGHPFVYDACPAIYTKLVVRRFIQGSSKRYFGDLGSAKREKQRAFRT
jgi:hypothetical protein